MIIIGDKLIPCDNFARIKSIEDIVNTKPNSIVVFEFDKEILRYCLDNHIFCAPIVDDIKQSIISNSLNAKYQICTKEIATKLQKIAENYIYDSRILAIIEDEDEIEELATNSIDGVIYKRVI